MAEYGDNPFADPRQTSNPFGQQPGDNPFQVSLCESYLF